MYRTAAKQMQVGNSVIIDSPLSRRRLYDEAQALAEKVLQDIAGLAQTMRGLPDTAVLRSTAVTLRWSNASSQKSTCGVQG